MGGKIIGGLIAFVVGAALFGVGFWMQSQKSAIKKYMETEGEVISSRIDSHTDSDGDQMYKPEIKYVYVVDGEKYESDRYAYLGSISSSSSGGARKIVHNYPAGEKCAVFYDPADPMKSVLDKKPGGIYKWFPIIFLGIGGLVLLVPIGGLVFYGLIIGLVLSSRKKTPEPGRAERADFDSDRGDSDSNDLPKMEEM
ncbi:MAG: DUF3592 domain-containing protein [Planctomycetes bacterium]|nr:DUF3592 domain-containing protein [Planctomycetota bacterium]